MDGCCDGVPSPAPAGSATRSRCARLSRRERELRKPPVQHERAGLAGGTEHPGALPGSGFDDVVIAAHVLAVPPTAFDAFGTGEDPPHRGTQRDRPLQQPGGTWLPRRFVRAWFAV